jgi:hypothetical protein
MNPDINQIRNGYMPNFTSLCNQLIVDFVAPESMYLYHSSRNTIRLSISTLCYIRGFFDPNSFKERDYVRICPLVLYQFIVTTLAEHYTYPLSNRFNLYFKKQNPTTHV